MLDGNFLAPSNFDELLLPVFVSCKLGASLSEITDCGRTETGE